MRRTSVHVAVGVLAAIALSGTPANAEWTPTAADPLSSWPGMSYVGLVNHQDDPAAQAIQPMEPVVPAGCSSTCGGCPRCYGLRGRNQCRRWISGVEATFLQPNIHGRDIEYVLFDGVGAQLGGIDPVDAEELTASPRVWLGLQGERWGLLLRFWSLNNSELAYAPFGTTVGSTALGRLDVYTIDVEATRDICFRGHNMVGSIGVRYAEFDHQYVASGFNVIGGDLFSATAVTDHHLGSAGPTFSLNGMHPIRCGKWNVFWNARGSVLFGETQHVAETSAQASGAGGAAASINTAIAAADEALFIGECQLGLQRDYHLECIPALAFFRFGFEYQYWDADSQGGAISTSFATLGTGTVVSSASAADLRMELVGLAVATGFHW